MPLSVGSLASSRSFASSQFESSRSPGSLRSRVSSRSPGSARSALTASSRPAGPPRREATFTSVDSGGDSGGESASSVPSSPSRRRLSWRRPSSLKLRSSPVKRTDSSERTSRPLSPAARWNHIDDLDTFFTRVYQYHQQHGFLCMMTRQFLELFQFFFVVTFSFFLVTCVDYDRLFNCSACPSLPSSPWLVAVLGIDTAGTASPYATLGPPAAGSRSEHRGKTTLWDVLLPAGQCMARPPASVVLCLLVAAFFWLLRMVKVGYNFVQFWEIKVFFNAALGISDSELDNHTWYEVQQRLREVQHEQQMCIHKTDLTELDIYNRILRFKNYMVAMVNKQVLPLRFNVPCLGEVVYLSKGLKYNLELLLFWGPGSPFENNWHLKADYKRVGKRRQLSEELARRVLWVGVINLVLCPVILLWQVLYCFYNYAELIKREPGSLGMRRWSLYGRFFLRHFNELDHELKARLNMGYKASNKYMDSFTTPFTEIIAQNVMFVSGALLAVLLGLTIYDEDVITVEHVLTLMTLLGGLVAVCRVFIADENLVFAPEQLMAAVLAHVHYMPDHWRGQAHTGRVMHEFSQMFQLKAYFLMEELLSPIVTPFILCFYLRQKSLDIVDFFRNFTVDVIGVGDVCSFAQMDVRRHGHPAWRPAGGGGGPAGSDSVEPGSGGEQRSPSPVAEGPAEEATRADHGKTELSLVHFAITNPGWRPPESSEIYISTLRAQGARDAACLGQAGLGAMPPLAEENALFSSLQALGSVGCQQYGPPLTTALGGSSLNGQGSLLASVHEGLYQRPDLQASLLRPTAAGLGRSQVPEFNAAEMAISAVYMHEIHQRTLQHQQQQSRLGTAPGGAGYGGATPRRDGMEEFGGDTSVRYAPSSSRGGEHEPLLDLSRTAS
ncbi:Autophagy-related protein 9A [Amphibalanus amphitrite]|uniref:Autophagy-related protein 9 n=1 Tax=Amphibalanus amphitrite TaxID=1232801 RepID=A0A6A4WF30_AMPAM|nr:Autophagy-related protein 9A [Amphibalanus amphitrite]